MIATELDGALRVVSLMRMPSMVFLKGWCKHLLYGQLRWDRDELHFQASGILRHGRFPGARGCWAQVVAR